MVILCTGYIIQSQINIYVSCSKVYGPRRIDILHDLVVEGVGFSSSFVFISLIN